MRIKKVHKKSGANNCVSIDQDGWVGFWRADKLLTEVLTNSFYLSNQKFDQQLRAIAGWLA